MKVQIFATATLLTAFSTALPAVDAQLLNLVMPDAKVMAGVNVTQAKASPFGQYVLSQMTANDTDIQQLSTLTGFDPRRDVNELLLSSTAAPGKHSGLATATGTFDVNAIVTYATGKGAKTETYGGVTILEDPDQTHGVAFLSGSLVAAGDIASVKAAIDRFSQPAILPAAVVTQVKQLSASQDAWAMTTVPPASLNPGAGVPNVPGLGNGLQTSLGSVQSMSGGVKFGAIVAFTAQAQTDTAQNATALAGVVQFLANMAQLQAAKQNPQAATALQSLTATASGTMVTVNLSLPEDQFQQILKPQAKARPHREQRK